MKLMPMIMLLVVLQLTIMVFDTTYDQAHYNLNPYNVTSQINNSSPNVFDFIMDPTGWGDSAFLGIWIGLISVAGAIGIGVYLYTKSDLALLFGAFTALLGFGAIPIISLYNIINREIALFGCTVGSVCVPSLLIWGLTGGLISIFYVGSVIEWWSGRSMS